MRGVDYTLVESAYAWRRLVASLALSTIGGVGLWSVVVVLPAVQAEFHALTGDLPPRRSPWLTPALANDPYAKAFREQLERAVSTPKVPEWERIATEMRLVGEQVANGRLTVDQAAEELDRRADRILEKRRWMLEQAAKPGAAP